MKIFLNHKSKQQPGFTLVELMLALAFFSFILMFLMGGFILIARNYNQGVTSSRIHQAGRNLMEQMVRDFRQSSVKPKFYRATGTDDAYICYSNGTYRAIDDLTATNGGLLQRTNQNLTDDCDSNAIIGLFNSSSAEEVLDTDEVAVVDIGLLENADSLFTLNLSLASANITDTDLGIDSTSDGENDKCSAATSGSEFCDVVTLSTKFSTTR